MWEVVRGLTATGVTVLLTTQYLEEADLLAGQIAVVDHGTVTVPVAGEDVMPAAVRRLEEQGIAVAELTLRGSTLDEVFLSLTGRRTEKGTADELAGSAA